MEHNNVKSRSGEQLHNINCAINYCDPSTGVQYKCNCNIDKQCRDWLYEEARKLCNKCRHDCDLKASVPGCIKYEEKK